MYLQNKLFKAETNEASYLGSFEKDFHKVRLTIGKQTHFCVLPTRLINFAKQTIRKPWFDSLLNRKNVLCLMIDNKILPEGLEFYPYYIGEADIASKNWMVVSFRESNFIGFISNAENNVLYNGKIKVFAKDLTLEDATNLFIRMKGSIANDYPLFGRKHITSNTCKVGPWGVASGLDYAEAGHHGHAISYDGGHSKVGLYGKVRSGKNGTISIDYFHMGTISGKFHKVLTHTTKDFEPNIFYEMKGRNLVKCEPQPNYI